MSKSKTYRATNLKALDIPRLLVAITSAVVVSIDVAKASFVAAIETALDGVVRIIRFEHPTETRAFLDLVRQLKEHAGSLAVLMEPTGTYGDALRHQLNVLGIEVRRVQPKHTHDAKELFDSVPSKHDAKDAVTMLQLHGAGSSAAWKPHDDERRAMRAMLDRHALHDQRQEELSNQIEARLARHWPEFESWMSIRQHVSARALLEEFATPQRIAEDPERARALLRRASHGALSRELIDAVCYSASHTLGVVILDEEEEFLRDLITELQREIRIGNEIEKKIEQRAKSDVTIQSMRRVVGVTAACAIVTYLGSPANYGSSRSILKAAGMNVRESSSGTQKGGIHITKRGPSIVRKLLYFAALRAISNDPVVRAWFQGRESYQAGTKASAVVAVMRKLLAAAYRVGKDHVEYDSTKLFDVRRLMLPAAESVPAKRTRPLQRTSPRSIARGARRARRSPGGVTA